MLNQQAKLIGFGPTRQGDSKNKGPVQSYIEGRNCLKAETVTSTGMVCDSKAIRPLISKHIESVILISNSEDLNLD